MKRQSFHEAVAEVAARVRKPGVPWSPWPDSWRPVIDPGSLRPGVDRLIHRPSNMLKGARQLEWCERCTWIGNHVGMAIVQPDKRCGPFLIEPAWLDEADFLHCPTLNWEEFENGWHQGRVELLKDRGIAERSSRSMPTAFGRGLIKGFSDTDQARRLRPGSPTPYNEVARWLNRRFPNEHPEASVSNRS